MAEQLTVTFSNRLSNRVRQVAEQRHEDVIALVETILDEALSARLNEMDWVDLSESDETVDRETQAYIQLHPFLLQNYFGKFVAVHGGKLIDHAEDFDTLYERIIAEYPDEFVWISEVKDEPIETFTVRSPRFTQGAAR
jgi:hypothetical protein